MVMLKQQQQQHQFQQLVYNIDVPNTSFDGNKAWSSLKTKY